MFIDGVLKLIDWLNVIPDAIQNPNVLRIVAASFLIPNPFFFSIKKI